MTYPFTIGGLLALVVCTIDYFALEPFILCGMIVYVAFMIETYRAINKWLFSGCPSLQ